MDWIKAKLIAKKAWLWAKKFWWVIVVALLFVCAGLIGALTRNGVFLAGVLDLMEAKRAAHDQEMETLSRIHDTEAAEKNARLKEHLKRKAELRNVARNLIKKKKQNLKGWWTKVIIIQRS